MPQVVVNVTMPSELKQAIDGLVAGGFYTSVSEVVREGSRRMISDAPKLTVNGFTREFEDMVLETENDPVVGTIETKEDMRRFLKRLQAYAKIKK